MDGYGWVDGADERQGLSQSDSPNARTPNPPELKNQERIRHSHLSSILWAQGLKSRSSSRVLSSFTVHASLPCLLFTRYGIFATTL